MSKPLLTLIVNPLVQNPSNSKRAFLVSVLPQSETLRSSLHSYVENLRDLDSDYVFCPKRVIQIIRSISPPFDADLILDLFIIGRFSPNPQVALDAKLKLEYINSYLFGNSSD